jgi:lipopolysaccharide/colanic/teichoic acid biosynthesis glycosyltransferase
MYRVFDILFSGVALFLLLPLFIVVGLLLRVTGEGEILFTQERIGYNGKFFGLLKFATMLKNSPNIGTRTITVARDPRILPIGKFLRKSKINELPQLVNVFLGQMSLVGPRPLTKETFDLYPEQTQTAIKRVRPGLSGIQQIVIRDEEGLVDRKMVSDNFYNSTLVPYKGELEEWFVSNNSLGTYFLTILMTIWIVLTPKNHAVWIILPNIPEPPIELQKGLSYKLK